MALKRLDVRGLSGRLDEVLPRPEVSHDEVAETVSAIIAQVRRQGDDAVRAFTERFDRVALSDLAVGAAEAADALARLAPPLREALEVAHRRIAAYHERQVATDDEFVSDGVRVNDLVRPLERVGCYAPGGLARYPSTVLMCATPARVAGVAQVVLCVPPGADGRVDDATLAAAAIAGVDEIYRVGGAQAIAALAYGTETIRPVDAIVGPGNRYVAEAMRQVSGVVGIPASFAGPSEVLVVAGPGAPPELAAVDLAVQAEHGPDGASWLVSWVPEKLDEIEAELDRIVAASPRRATLESTLCSGGFACLVDGPEQAIEVANVVAPEHLELMVDGARELLALVRSAGAVFLGPWSPASFGDYVAGTNHVLPTNRTARFASALSARDFQRHIHVVEVDRRALELLGPHVVTLAETEGLAAHAESIERRR